ncbi:conserved hypothetical protein [Streptomyces sp. SPB78]|nr:conserved hypothetical protein [Streptomyces sp. SPB78]
MQLRLLGASHQVLLEDEHGECSETVACLPGGGAPLPVGVVEEFDGFDYHFAARVEELPPGAFAGRAQELLALVAEHPHGLAGVFPGSPDAFTAMLVQRRDGETQWRTWHAYPEDGQLVVTRTRLAPRPAALSGTRRGRARRGKRLAGVPLAPGTTGLGSHVPAGVGAPGRPDKTRATRGRGLSVVPKGIVGGTDQVASSAS